MFYIWYLRIIMYFALIYILFIFYLYLYIIYWLSIKSLVVILYKYSVHTETHPLKDDVCIRILITWI